MEIKKSEFVAKKQFVKFLKSTLLSKFVFVIEETLWVPVDLVKW